MRNQRLHLYALALLTAASIWFALWNIADEFFNIPDEYARRKSISLAYVIVVAAMWLIVPCVNFLVGAFTRTRSTQIVSMCIALGLALFILQDALNGPSYIQHGAQHMHIFIVPILVLFCYSAYCFILVTTKILSSRYPLKKTESQEDAHRESNQGER